MKPVILISMNVAPVGGIGADLLKCIRTLCKQGREVHVIYGFMDPATAAALPGCQVRWHRVYMPKRPPVFAQVSIWLAASLICRKIKQRHPDTHTICFERLPLGDTQFACAPNALWMAVRKKIGASPFSKVPYRLWCAWMDSLIQRKTDASIIIFSARDRDALINNGVEPKRVKQLIIPTDTARFIPDSAAPRPCITIIGADAKLKGIDLALEIWPEIQAQFPELTLRIVTHGWKVKKSLPTDLDRIEVADFIPDVERYYHSSRLVLMPSLFETWGNVVLEALACGVPVVASSAVPSSEIICNSTAGEVFERDGIHDAAALKQAVLNVLNQPQSAEDMQERHRMVDAFISNKEDLIQWVETL